MLETWQVYRFNEIYTDIKMKLKPLVTNLVDPEVIMLNEARTGQLSFLFVCEKLTNKVNKLSIIYFYNTGTN